MGIHHNGMMMYLNKFLLKQKTSKNRSSIMLEWFFILRLKEKTFLFPPML